jgi:hypothetical protein
MKARLGPTLFWIPVALAVLMIAAIIVGRGRLLECVPMLAGLGFALVGRLLTSRRPENAVGWILALIGIVLAVAALTEGYVANAPESDPLLALELAGWLTQFIWFLWLPGLVGIALPLLFPDGHLPSPRWRWIAWAGVVGTLLGTLGTAFKPGAIEVDAAVDVENPFGISGAGEFISVVEGLGFVLTSVGVVGAGAAVIMRLRRSRGVERQQLKWFAYVASMIVAGLTVATLSSTLDEDSTLAQVIGPVGWFTALGMVAIGIPLATGIAVLRYRLYEIDVVINRTLVYVALTATLAVAYLGSVLLLQLVLSPSSDLAIAASTLAVAALFRPARSRIQGVVDRRFYRRRYDAARTLERFGVLLRDQVDLDALGARLRGVVAETMQPEHVTLWLPRNRRIR